MPAEWEICVFVLNTSVVDNFVFHARQACSENWIGMPWDLCLSCTTARLDWTGRILWTLYSSPGI